MIKKKGQKGLVLSFLGVIATALVLSIGFGPSAALADTGVGNGVGGGGSASGSRWVAGWGAKGVAWNDLRNNSNLYKSGSYDGSLESLMRNNVRPPNGYNIEQFINLCKDSSVIWWIQDSASNYRFWGKSYATNASTDTILSGTRNLSGYDREKTDARNALNAYGNDAARKDITIVCSAVYTPPETYKSRVWNANQGVSATYNANVSHTYTETPDYAPANNLSVQSRTVNTVYKGAFDSANVNSVDSFNSTNANLSGAANSSDQNPSRDNFLPVGDPNRDGLAQQGALSLATTSTSATITIGYTRNQNLVQYATCDAAGNNCNWNGQPGANPGYNVTGVSGESWASGRPADSGWYQVQDDGWRNDKSGPSTRDNGYFQILSSKCNVNWFLGARNTAPGNAPLNTGISNYSLPDNNVLNTGHNNYVSRPTVSGDNTVLMGVRGDSTNVGNANGVEKTSYISFYNRPCSDGRWANEQVNVNGTAEWNQPYSYSSDIVRQAITGGPSGVVDPIGADNLRDQKGVEGNGYSRTSYGALRDRMAAGNGADTNIYGSVDKAVAADQNFPTPSITLNQGNQEGMAEGGVLNVFERTRWADISSFQNDLYYRAIAQTAIYNWDSASGSWKIGTWTNNVKDDGSTNLNATQLAEVNGSGGARGWKNSLSDRGIAAPGPGTSYPCGTSVSNAPGACPPSGVNHKDIVVTIPDNSNAATINGIYTGAAPDARLGWYKKATTYSNKQNLDTPQDTGFWQMMSVHCNPDELDLALHSLGDPDREYYIVSQTKTDTGVTTVVHTPRRPAMPTASGAQLLGFSSSPVVDPALLRTGNLGFYDKECSIQCTTDSATGSGASATNGAVSNVSNNGNLPQLDELGGAVSDATISNYFEMFRDNKDRTITTNIAYPNVSGTVFNYDGHAPLSTTATLWKDANTDPAARLTVPEGDSSYPVGGGTPDTSPAGGQLNVTAIGGTGSGAAKNAQDLFTGTQAPSTQKNFTGVDATHPVDTFNGPYSTQVAGAYNKFNVSATWASLKDRPVVMNVKWEYQPTTNTTVPKTVGFDLNDTEKIDETASFDQKIDVRCYANYGSSNSITPDGAMAASKQTGTGTTNVIDRNVLNAAELGNGGADTTAYKNGSNLVIKFVRGVAE